MMSSSGFASDYSCLHLRRSPSAVTLMSGSISVIRSLTKRSLLFQEVELSSFNYTLANWIKAPILNSIRQWRSWYVNSLYGFNETNALKLRKQPASARSRAKQLARGIVQREYKLTPEIMTTDRTASAKLTGKNFERERAMEKKVAKQNRVAELIGPSREAEVSEYIYGGGGVSATLLLAMICFRLTIY